MSEQKKKIIILKHNGGRLGNQLLLYISVYAFCLEKNYECINYSFYNYRKYFDIPSKDVYMHLFDLLGKLNLYKSHSSHLLVYYIYRFFTSIYLLFNKGVVIKELSDDYTFLPPTRVKAKLNQELVDNIINNPNENIYLEGWTFRNPVGIKKYHSQIMALFTPKKEILQKIIDFKNRFTNYYLVGVHIRQGDYKRFQGGKLYFSLFEVSKILSNFIKDYKGRKKLKFIICSDGNVNLKHFKNLDVTLGPGSLIEDLYLLSSCKLIIGSDSTFGVFASYLGNIPFKKFSRSDTQ